jgi:predicted phage terminase large subunit-like protein
MGDLMLQDTFAEDPLDVAIREEGRCCFRAFRRYMNPAMLVDWWQYEIALEFDCFYLSLINGERPKLVLMAPPQHGKTQLAKDFIAWLAGRRPDLKTIFTTYSDELGAAVNTDLQRIMTSEPYLATFGHRLASRDASSSRWLRNNRLLEYVNTRGSFRNTTVQGQITGKGLDIGIVDDPIKGRAEASSKAIRDKTWNWFTDDFFPRFSDSAGLLIIMTRWHVDDPVGRFLEHFPGAKVLRYPAIAEQDETYRLKGEALFPAHKSMAFLMERKAVMTQAAWESEYQQNPIVMGGGIFPIHKLEIVAPPAPKHTLRSVRYWDKAGTSDSGSYTAGVFLHLMRDQTFIVGDVRRGRWSALDRERIIKQTADADCASYGSGVVIWVEQEPGSGGKESAEATVRMLAGHQVHADKVTGNKEVRAQPYAAQVQAGNVALARGAWNREFLDEHEAFPAGKYKDQVDAASGAFNKIVSGSTYDISLSWVL